MTSSDLFRTLDHAVLTAALQAPGTRGAVAEIARAVLDGQLTPRQAARSTAAQALADLDRIADALRHAAEDPDIGAQVQRLRQTYRSTL